MGQLVVVRVDKQKDKAHQGNTYIIGGEYDMHHSQENNPEINFSQLISKMSVLHPTLILARFFSRSVPCLFRISFASKPTLPFFEGAQICRQSLPYYFHCCASYPGL
eukprot:scaffold9441_cov167-Amphora_coffeaeformis.AAC.2